MEKISIDTKVVYNLSIKLGNFNFEKLSINNEIYVKVIMEDGTPILQKGYPDLPKLTKSIIIPDSEKTDYNIINARYEEYEDIQILPSKGNLLRTVDPNKIPYEFGKVYEMDEWYPKDIAKLREPYILRDFRGQVVEIYPFQYNPVQKRLRVYHDISLEIVTIGGGGKNIFHRDSFNKIDPTFKSIYERHFENFDDVIKDTTPIMGERYTPVDDIGNMVVICYDDFYNTTLPFVEWKNMKGIPTEIVNLSDVGGTATSIKNYITNYYNTNGLTFVLLVGDIAQMPTLYSSGYLSDPSYSYIVGADHYPDLFVGRFSAQNIAQLQTQVERSIEYEKYPQVDAAWYSKGTGIASDDGTGNGDDNEWDWEHIRNIRTDLLAYTYTLIDEFYEGSQGGADAPGDPTSSMLSTAFNDGRSIVNYCGHGYYQSWSTGGYSNGNINSLVNDNMLPYIVSVACLNGVFDYSGGDCFAEAWMKATNGGEPTGAIGIYAASKSQAWDPPMDAQDEIVDILIETYDPFKPRSIGALSYNGAMHMNDEYGSAGYIETDCWHLFGDPSLQIRTATPQSLNVIHDDFIMLGTTDYSVIVPGVENALCALSMNGRLIAYGYTDSTGNVTLDISGLNDTGTLNLVVTGFNRIPYLANVTATGELAFDLYSGWNLITIPVENNYTASSLALLIPECDMIAWWDAASGQYVTYIVGVTPPGSQWDFSIEDGVSYYLSVTSDTTFVVNGTPLTAISVPLYPGWNAIGWWKTRSVTASVLASQITDCEIIAKWDAASGQYVTYIVGVTPPGSQWDFSINAGMGLLVKVSSSSVWN